MYRSLLAFIGLHGVVGEVTKRILQRDQFRTHHSLYLTRCSCPEHLRPSLHRQRSPTTFKRNWKSAGKEESSLNGEKTFHKD